jgi:Putative zinc-finger
MESSKVMNHQEAENTKATERYLLREMTDDERKDFEEHYLDCPECLEAVTFGADFLDAGRDVAEQGAADQRVQRVAAVPHKTWLAFLKPLWQPVPAMAAATALCLAVLGVYQQTRIAKQQNMIADLKAPRQEIRYVVSSGQRMGSEAVVLSRNERLSFLINFVPKHEFISYRAEITGAGLAKGYSIPVAASEKDYSVTVSLPAAALAGGDYEVMFWGRTQAGDETKLASGSLEVKLED